MAPAKKATAPKRGRGERELIDTGTDKRFVKRTASGQFKESDDVGKSLAADRRKKAKTTTKRGYGDRGDMIRQRPAANVPPASANETYNAIENHGP